MFGREKKKYLLILYIISIHSLIGIQISSLIPLSRMLADNGFIIQILRLKVLFTKNLNFTLDAAAFEDT